MRDYKEILEKKPDVCLLDGHLVDVQGTLIPLFGNKLNEALYKSMLKAQEAGEKIYIYSSLPNAEKLKAIGIDTEKFEVISKAQFEGYKYTIVTGKIVDDTRPDISLNIILTNPNGHIYPNKETYSFERTPMPEDLAEYYQRNVAEQHRLEELKKQREERQNLVDPLERKQKIMEKALWRGMIPEDMPVSDSENISREIIRKMKIGRTADPETGEVHKEHKLAAKIQTNEAKKFILKSHLENQGK